MKKQSYTPNAKTLAKYADLIVRFGLQTQSGKAPKKGSVIQFTVPEVAKPLYFHLQAAILKNGHHPLGNFIPSSDETYTFERNFYTNASKDQLEFIPTKYHKALIDQIDATIYVVAETNTHELDGISGEKVMSRSKVMRPIKDLKFKKIDAGKLSWTIVMYGTDQTAAEAGMSSKVFWDQIIKACYLDHKNPVAEWHRIDRTVSKTAKKLTEMLIKELHWSGKDIDLTVGIGKDRTWRAGGGNNIPSYEVFTSPNFREVNGWIRFNQPHYKYNKRIEDIELWFENGKVVKSKATKNHDLLKSMLKTEGGNQLGEISLTDSRLSRITKPTGEILYDENMGGRYGNTHVAIGFSFHDCYKGDGAKFTKKQWRDLGFNDSIVHSDFVSTTNRTVTATLYDGSEVVIYKDGKFTI